MQHFIQRAAFCAAILTAALGLWSCGSSSAPTASDLLTRTRLARYQQWNRVNPTPIHSTLSLGGSCANPFTPEMLPDPHDGYYVTVYVNDTGKDAMLQQRNPVFPVGTVIVKQKSPHADGSNPVLLTAMEKRDAGYNPGNGDWHYAVLDGDAAKVQTEGKIAHCQNCHQTANMSGYTFRQVYLPNEIYQQLYAYNP